MSKLENLILVLRDVLSKYESIIFAYLFGSQATGKTHRYSDVDVAVYLKKYSVKLHKKIFFDLANVVDKEINLVILNDAPPLLRHKVIKDGILLFSRDDALRKKFIEQTLIEALDFKVVYDYLIMRKGEKLIASRKNS